MHEPLEKALDSFHASVLYIYLAQQVKPPVRYHKTHTVIYSTCELVITKVQTITYLINCIVYRHQRCDILGYFTRDSI